MPLLVAKLSAERNLEALFAAMAALPGAESSRGRGIMRVLAPHESPMFKAAYGAGFAPEGANRAIATTIRWFRDRGATHFFWWLGPSSRPTDLGARLEARGLKPFDSEPVLTCTAAKFVPGALPGGFVVRPAHEALALEDFTRVFVPGFGAPDWAARAWTGATQAFAGPAPWTVHVGYLDGAPVACALTLSDAGIVGLYGVAVLPAARRKGLGAAITRAALAPAFAAGARRAVLWPTDMSHALYRKLGFRETGARCERYLWMAG